MASCKNDFLCTLTAEQEVVGLIPRTGPILRVLKSMRKESTAFALQAARYLGGSDGHVKWRSHLQWEM